MAAATVDKTKPYFPLAGGADDGWSKEDSATATCFCGAVQLEFPTQGPGLLGTFVCNCTDCRKITASMFASNFVIADTHLTHVRGRDNLTAYGQSRTRSSSLFVLKNPQLVVWLSRRKFYILNTVIDIPNTVIPTCTLPNNDII